MQYPVEIIQIKMPKRGKMPIVLELPVPPKCRPLLVGNPKEKTAGKLKWVESPTKEGSVYTWGVETTLESLMSFIEEMIVSRGEEEGWDVVFKTEEEAIQRMTELGFDEVRVVYKGWVLPKDLSMFGSIVIFEDGEKTKMFPLIHAPSVGVCFIKP